jgi:hypothetical protein
MAEPIGGALIISKLRNCLNNDTFKFITCCKSWGVFKDEEDEIKKAEKESKGTISEEDNLFFIQTKE